MNIIVDYWMLIVATICVVIIAGITVYQFFKRPTEAQFAQVKEWLLIAVIEAEKALGSKTGQIKLRFVWDMFLQRFPAISVFVTFEMFSGWVDDALVKMREIIDSNEAVADYVENVGGTYIFE